jgi:predicted component of type VI protein secretion system
MKLSLVVLTEGKQQGKVLNIPLAQFLIGRDPQCHLRPASALISKRHCALIQRDGKAYIRDFDSTNGTLLNDQPVKGEVELHHDDQLKVGPLLFAVRLEASPPVNRPTPAPPTKAAATLSSAATKTVREPKPEAATANATPPPKTAPKPEPAPAGGNGAEDDIAALLLSLDDDGTGNQQAAEVPEGSTVMDVPAPVKEDDPAGSTAKMQTGKPGEKDKKKPDGNTANAAKSILEKYMRRPRSER